MRFPYTSAICGLSLVYVACSQSLPYNPTTIFLPSSSSGNREIAYVFLTEPESNAPRLASLNISSTISQSDLSLETLTSSLPFTSYDSTAFIPTLSATGEIYVYAGSCNSSSDAALWRFSPDDKSITGNGTWAQETVATASVVTSTDLPGPNYLSSAFSFSTLVQANASDIDIFVFGGMCPVSGATTATWQPAASYSNHMLKFSPTSRTAYTLDIADSRGPPIAEAGFTTTGLSPTFSNVSGTLTQGQNLVLVGGHTQTAFINMSTVAVWSLPQESWSFETVASPSSASNSNNELAVKSIVNSVDSRSGHTAVLTEDGSQIIVMGGWVGDITQAAEPQLAVLNVASGFGGTGDWSWLIPEEQPSGSGIYGHGAVMLPGNVMMILGGYSISSSASTDREASLGTKVNFYNATSMSFLSNYTNPAYVAAASKSKNSSSNSNTKKIGLGAGLGIGLPAIIAAFLFCCCYRRHLGRRRTIERNKAISSLNLGAANFFPPSTEMNQTGGVFPWSNGRWNTSSVGQDTHLSVSSDIAAGYENFNTGVHGLGDYGGIPSPPRQIPRKPLKSRNARGLYQPTPNIDFNPVGPSLGTAGPIHPIYEADEDDQALPPINTAVGFALGDPSLSSAPGSSSVNRNSNPFKDPPIITYSNSLRRDNRSIMTDETDTPAQAREREIQEWVSDWAAADMLLHSQTRSPSQAGRLSPTRRAQLIAASTTGSVSGEEDSARTASNLSERSIAASMLTVSRSGSSSQDRSRSSSLRGFISNAMNPFSVATAASTTVSPLFDVPGRSKNNQAPGSAGSCSSSFTTARTSLPILQAEGESLLARPDDLSSPENSPTRSQADSAGSPSKHKALPLGVGRQRGWLGSLRKGFFGAGASGNGNDILDSQIRFSREPSPIRAGGADTPPRRAVSAGSTMWRRKQGRSDWEDSANFSTRPAIPRSNTLRGDLSTSSPILQGSPGVDDDDEWDIERAVENRVVQVMFTVPKERLRVVNTHVDDDRSETLSLRSKNGSNKSLKAAESFTSLLEPVGKIETPVTPEGKGKGLLTVPFPLLEPAGEVGKRVTPESKVKGKGKVLDLVEKMEERSRANSSER